jgi:hypothetical protein
MFTVSQPFVLFDYFRVPHRQQTEVLGALRPPTAAWETVWASANVERSLSWISDSEPWQSRLSGAFRIDSIPMFGNLLTDDDLRPLLEELGGSWHRSLPICDSQGTWVASIWRSGDGKIFLPFDPNAVIRSYWSEGYLKFVGSELKTSLRSVARATYYRAKPLIPRRAQILVRRWFSRFQAGMSFPRWPVETCLHDLYELLFALLESLVEEPVPIIAPWPAGHRWAFVLTHDVESAAGYANVDLLCDIEVGSAYRSSWNFVPLNHHVRLEGVIEGLKEKGFEVGVHGLRHDGRDITELEDRLPAIREWADRWNAAGFRSPATLRDWETMHTLGFDYDSTYFDTSPYEPQPGGCCTWLPYMIGTMVELPTTLPQDHTLFEILGGLDETLWLDKARFLRERGGMVLVLSHPDYARNERLARAYKRLLDEFADDATAWKALPREVSQWWRRRAASVLERGSDGAWRVVGPAAEDGSVAFPRDKSVQAHAGP